jgi:predicted nucleic acid-binding protein
LHDLYLEIVVPPAVQAELSKNGIELDPLWTRVVAAQDKNDIAALREQLDPGEAEAIVVAAELAAELLLVDENADAGSRLTVVWKLQASWECSLKLRHGCSYPDANPF